MSSILQTILEILAQATLRRYRPQIVAITGNVGKTSTKEAIADVPVHVEYFTDPGQVAKEKSQLIAHLDKDGHAILNSDDPAVLAMKEKTTGHVITFGFSESAQARVSNFEVSAEGVTFKIH